MSRKVVNRTAPRVRRPCGFPNIGAKPEALDGTLDYLQSKYEVSYVPAFPRALGSYRKPPHNGCCLRQETRDEVGLR